MSIKCSEVKVTIFSEMSGSIKLQKIELQVKYRCQNSTVMYLGTPLIKADTSEKPFVNNFSNND